MKRFATGLFLVLHGLAHSALGMAAQDTPRGLLGDLPSTARVALATALFAAAAPGFVAAGFGRWGVAVLAGRWRELTWVAALASALLVLGFSTSVASGAAGLMFDGVALALAGVRLPLGGGRVWPAAGGAS